ncbi:MAG: bifunctional DNA-formamidopyrimidine glycosylase/DNA-(apurinic or apyrimidinic site) lyase, partial [Gammaproteobacteria bacterium]|nr:bifunctional DNA-formamidopyrimidine glycosylase/DNA-(apurinic or apyrimidinic site) lyase [Gammaproteobacteria bacterium]
MPELPEVETTRKGIEPHLLNQTISQIVIRQKQLRWPIPSLIKDVLKNQIINAVERRAKYLLIKTAAGTLIIHLGMSGSLRVLASNSAAQKHDHFELQLSNGQCLRLRDPRRFGSVLWTDQDPLQHKLLINLGPEPFSAEFNATAMYQISRQRKVSIKQFIMNANIVCGVGNIYASEALFISGIHPQRQAGRISLKRYALLCDNIKTLLKLSIKL